MKAFICFCEVRGHAAVGMFATREAAQGWTAPGDVVCEVDATSHVHKPTNKPTFFWPHDQSYRELIAVIERERIRECERRGLLT